MSCIFLVCVGVRRFLLSFPTRRSSDLVPPRDMRQKPIGTGPFKFVEFKPNEHIKVAKNPDYWKPGRPYLEDRKSTRLNSSHLGNSYAVFCLKRKNLAVA